MAVPKVSIVIPCYNEAPTIRALLEAIYAQTFPRSDMEVVIADGMSEDDTRIEIENFRNAHGDLAVSVVENPARYIPAGLNCAIRSSQGEIIIRMDAHSRPNADYVERCVADLEADLGENVGGVWDIQPGGKTWIAESIALAAAHPLGVGNAAYRIGSRPSSVDTVPFGAFRRELVEEIGFFNEALLANEDYEFNARIRKNGGRIWLDPKIVTVYFARSSLRELVRQYWRYGYWKFRMLRAYPGTLRLRQALPPLFVAAIAIFAALSWLPGVPWVLGSMIALYVLPLLAVSALALLKRPEIQIFLGLPLSMAAMHLSWGAGFLWSMILSIFERKKQKVMGEAP